MIYTSLDSSLGGALELIIADMIGPPTKWVGRKNLFFRHSRVFWRARSALHVLFRIFCLKKGKTYTKFPII